MKKFLACVLVLIMSVSIFAACDGSDPNGDLGNLGDIIETNKNTDKNDKNNKDDKNDSDLNFNSFPMAPQIRIDQTSNEWEVSTDGGKTWQTTGVKASGKNGKDGNDGKDGNGILKTEVIDGCLWITYTNDPENPINAGKLTQDDYGLDFYPLPDGTYGVKAGRSLYLEEVIIPQTYNGKKVTSILENAFDGATSLKKITIPSTVNTIGEHAFLNCRDLTSITLPAAITNIYHDAFKNTTLTEVYYDGDMTSWCNINFRTDGWDDADLDWTNPIHMVEKFYVKNSSGEYDLVADLVIPDGVEKIKPFAFCGYKGLKSVTFPDSVTIIEEHAFTLTEFTSVTFGSNVPDMEQYAFYFSSNIKDLYYQGDIATWCDITVEPNSYTEYGICASPLAYADNFYIKNSAGTYELITELTIPEDVTKINDYAFYGYEKLKTVTMSDKVEVGIHAFADTTTIVRT